MNATIKRPSTGYYHVRGIPVSGRRMSGNVGSMALGNWDAGEGNCVTQRWVRSRLLLHVPPWDQATTLVTIAARADIDPRACRDHLRCMSSEVGTLERANRKTRYYRRTEDDMPHEDHDRTPLPERLAGLLAAATRPKTVLQMASELCVRPNTVSKMLIYMVEHGTVKRDGAGHRGDPYTYSDVDTISVAPIVDITPEDCETEAATRPVPPVTAGPMVDPMFIADAYALVIRDVQLRAREADHDRRMLDQVATLLSRIVDGEADR